MSTGDEVRATIEGIKTTLHEQAPVGAAKQAWSSLPGEHLLATYNEFLGALGAFATAFETSQVAIIGTSIQGGAEEAMRSVNAVMGENTRNPNLPPTQEALRVIADNGQVQASNAEVIQRGLDVIYGAASEEVTEAVRVIAQAVRSSARYTDSAQREMAHADEQLDALRDTAV